MDRITESSSLHDGLENLSSEELLIGINSEDKKVALAVEKEITAIARLVDAIVPRMQKGGRIFYIGAGTSGRLGIVDASECPPTFGVPHGMVIGIIAGGDNAIRKAVEFAEDDKQQAWNDLNEFSLTENDILIGIAASGTTPYVLGGIAKAKELGMITGGISCNPNSPLSLESDFPITPNVGPEFVTGSTRMKSGTAQKLVLNMISTSVMIRLGRVKGNKMVDMQLSNEKLIERGTRMVMQETGLDESTANEYLLKYGSVRLASEAYKANK